MCVCFDYASACARYPRPGFVRVLKAFDRRHGRRAEEGQAVPSSSPLVEYEPLTCVDVWGKILHSVVGPWRVRTEALRPAHATPPRRGPTNDPSRSAPIAPTKGAAAAAPPRAPLGTAPGAPPPQHAHGRSRGPLDRLATGRRLVLRLPRKVQWLREVGSNTIRRRRAPQTVVSIALTETSELQCLS